MRQGIRHVIGRRSAQQKCAHRKATRPGRRSVARAGCLRSRLLTLSPTTSGRRRRTRSRICAVVASNSRVTCQSTSRKASVASNKAKVVGLPRHRGEHRLTEHRVAAHRHMPLAMFAVEMEDQRHTDGHLGKRGFVRLPHLRPCAAPSRSGGHRRSWHSPLGAAWRPAACARPPPCRPTSGACKNSRRKRRTPRRRLPLRPGAPVHAAPKIRNGIGRAVKWRPSVSVIVAAGHGAPSFRRTRCPPDLLVRVIIDTGAASPRPHHHCRLRIVNRFARFNFACRPDSQKMRLLLVGFARRDGQHPAPNPQKTIGNMVKTPKPKAW